MTLIQIVKEGKSHNDRTISVNVCLREEAQSEGMDNLDYK